VNVVELSHITKRFGSVAALDDCSFEVGAGQIVALLGPSGCGKTTTLRIVAGFEQPDAGVVCINGQSMAGKRPYERNVGLLFQEYALFPHMTVGENIGYGLRRRGLRRVDTARRVEEMLRLVQLHEHESRWPAQLSGGQQQRVALARALATRPEVMLLDEPLSALDAKLRQELRVELKQILREAGMTSIVVTHDQEEAMSLSDTVIVMNAGRIVQRGAPAEVYARPDTRFVAEFIGQTNWFKGRLRPGPATGFSLFVTTDGDELQVPTPAAGASGEHDLCVRPERIALVKGPGTGSDPRDGVNLLCGTVVDRVMLGPDIHVIVAMRSGQRVSVLESNTGRIVEEPGTAVALRFDREACIVVPAEQADGSGGTARKDTL
jgi:ABC-type Fe3+/spermidine/putrescine transport system ATPase subunit